MIGPPRLAPKSFRWYSGLHRAAPVRGVEELRPVALVQPAIEAVGATAGDVRDRHAGTAEALVHVHLIGADDHFRDVLDTGRDRDGRGAVGGLIAPAVGVADDAIDRVALREGRQPVPGAVVAGGQPRKLGDVAARHGQIFDLLHVDGRVDRVARGLDQRGRAGHLNDLCHVADRQRGLQVRGTSGLHQHVVGLRREALERHGQFVRAEIEVHEGVGARPLGDGVTDVVRGDVRQGQTRPGKRAAAGIHDGDADRTERPLCPGCGS